MRCSLTCLAAIGLSAGLFAESQVANGYNWQYEHIPDGVRITSGSPVDGTFPKRLTVPGTLGGSPVLEVQCRSIEGDLAIQEIVLPQSLRRFDSSTWTSILSNDFFEYYNWNTEVYKERTTPLTVRFTGPAVSEFRANTWWYNDRAMVLFVYPESGAYQQSWEEMLKWQSFYRVAGDGAIWEGDGLTVPQYEPNLDARAAELKETLLAKYGTDANAKAAVDALMTLFELNADAGVRKALKKFGLTADGGVWTWDANDYDETNLYQPNDGVKVMTSDKVQAKITSAIASLAKIPATWGGMRLTDEDFSFIDGAICFDGADALLLKATLEGANAAFWLAKTYDLPVNYKNPWAYIEEATKLKGTDDASWAAAPKCPGEGGKFLESSSFQVGYIGDDLLLRLTFKPESGVEASDLLGAIYSLFLDYEDTGEVKVSLSAGKATARLWVSREMLAEGTYAIDAGKGTLTITLPGLADEMKTEPLNQWDVYYDYDGISGWHLFGGKKEIAVWLLESPKFLTKEKGGSSELKKAKSFAEQMLTTAPAALDALWEREVNDDLHLFNAPAGMTEADIKARKELAAQLKASLNTPTQVTTLGERLYLAPLFSENRPDRNHLPEINEKGAFVPGTAPDPSFCDILPDRGDGVIDPDPDPSEPDVDPTLPTISVTTEGAGTVKGAGAYKVGKKVTLRAKAEKDHVFAGWYGADGQPVASEGKDYRDTTLRYVMTEEDVSFTARFVSKADDAAIAIACALPEDGYAAGTQLSLPVVVTSQSLPRVSARKLPSGLRYNSKTQCIEGTPKKPGVFTFTVSVTNASKAKLEETFTLKVKNFVSEQIPVADSYAFQAGVTTPLDLSAIGDVRVSGLPAGMRWDAKTGTIIGTPKRPGTYTVTFVKGKEKASSTFEVADWADPTLEVEVEPETMAGAEVLWPVLTDSGNQVSARGLPSGVRLRRITDKVTKLVTFQLEGIPTKPGQYTLEVTAKNGGKKSITRTYAVTVLPNAYADTYRGLLLDGQGVAAAMALYSITGGEKIIKLDENGRGAEALRGGGGEGGRSGHGDGCADVIAVQRDAEGGVGVVAQFAADEATICGLGLEVPAAQVVRNPVFQEGQVRPEGHRPGFGDGDVQMGLERGRPGVPAFPVQVLAGEGRGHVVVPSPPAVHHEDAELGKVQRRGDLVVVQITIIEPALDLKLEGDADLASGGAGGEAEEGGAHSPVARE